MNEQITVMLVDDQQLVRGGLKMLINSQPDLQIVLEADDGAAALIAMLVWLKKVLPLRWFLWMFVCLLWTGWRLQKVF